MKKINKESKVYKTFSIIGDIILYTLFILSFCLLMFTISYKKKGDDGVNLFGHQVMTVLTPSMKECDKTDVSKYKIKSFDKDTLIAIKNVPENKDEAKKFYADIKVGDVLTFKYYYSTQTTITHRVIKIEPKDDGFIFTLQGDNKNMEAEGNNVHVGTQEVDTSSSNSNPFNYIVGKVVWTSPFLGTIVTFLKKPISLVFVIIVPCALIIIYEAFKITFYFIDKRKEKDKKELTNKDQEIEELKRKLLEAQGGTVVEDKSSETNEETPTVDEKSNDVIDLTTNSETVVAVETSKEPEKVEEPKEVKKETIKKPTVKKTSSSTTKKTTGSTTKKTSSSTVKKSSSTTTKKSETKTSDKKVEKNPATKKPAAKKTTTKKVASKTDEEKPSDK